MKKSRNLFILMIVSTQYAEPFYTSALYQIKLIYTIKYILGIICHLVLFNANTIYQFHELSLE